jgi:hypothetical protein
MDQKELNEARTNPEFLSYLEKTQIDAIETDNISALYEVLDSLLILDLRDNDRINLVYNHILKIAFEQIELYLKDEKKLSLEDDQLFYIRAFYEYGIEKWSYEDIKGAKELFFVLSQMVDDERLCDALGIHIIACSNGLDLDSFYAQKVAVASEIEDESHGYFITNFQFDTKEYLAKNSDILKKEFDALEHLLEQ